jgi:hypothetical protein
LAGLEGGSLQRLQLLLRGVVGRLHHLGLGSHVPQGRSASLKATNEEDGSESQKEQVDKRKAGGSKLTFDLLLLPLEGLVRLLGLTLQLENRGLLLLEGLAQILVRDADLNLLTVEPRHLLLLLLERGPRHLERGALPLEMAQRLLPRHALLLERGPGLDECGPLLLKLAFRLMACGSLLLELFLRRSERGSLVRQGRLKPLSLLEGRAAPLKLGAGGDDPGLPRRRDRSCPLQVLVSSAQRVVPLHQRRPHPLDRGCNNPGI